MPSNADEMEATDDHEPDGESGFPQPADEPVRDGDEAGGHTPGGNAPPAHMQDHTKPHSLSPSGADGKRRVVRVMLTLGSLVILATGGHFLLLQRMEEQWREFSEEFRQAALPETRRAIDEQVEDAFAPVYAAIPSLLDWHYSPRGRITKPILIVFGKLARISHTVTAEGFGGSVGAEFLPREQVEREQAALRPCFRGARGARTAA